MGFFREFFAPFFEPVCIAPVAAAEVQSVRRKRRRISEKGLRYYLNPRNGGQVACLVRILKSGHTYSSLHLKKRLQFAGHTVNDIGHRISDAIAAFETAGVTVESKRRQLKGKKYCHDYRVTKAGLKRLAELEASL